MDRLDNILIPSIRRAGPEATWAFALPLKLLEALQILSRHEGVPLSVTLLAAFQTLLHRYTNQDEVSVGLYATDDSWPEYGAGPQGTPRLFRFRSDFSGDPPFRELLQQARGVADSDSPKYLSVTQPAGDARGRSRPVLSMVVLETTPLSHSHLSGDFPKCVREADETAQFSLMLEFDDTLDSLRGHWRYDSELFDEASMSRWAAHFQNLLENIAAEPEQRISALPLMSQQELCHLVVGWNQTKADYPQRKLLHRLFEEQVERTPDAPALMFDKQVLTYRELNARANQLAECLRTRGVGTEAVVGICAERSVEMIVGVFGILKAGGAYLPLDPDYPRERLAFMLRDARMQVLLTQARLAHLLPQSEAQVILLDSALRFEPGAGIHNQASGEEPKNLAYVIYTSGSTGKPKGVLITHEAICNRLLWMQDTYRLDGADRVLQKTPFSFDVSVWEIFWPLLTGATLVMAQPGGHRDGDYLVRLIKTTQITTLHFVPSMLQVFLETGGVSECGSLKRVMCSGETLSLNLQRHFFERLDSELHNLYGPTEASVDVTYWRCNRSQQISTVPIGRPIANTQLYVLDKRLNPVPPGVPGELHIGGLPLARGYLNRADLTAEKFIPSPLGDAAGARLYKTGDLVRFRLDGNIEFLGRTDRQVKLRGLRIELGEIEAALEAHPGVQQSHVVARGNVRDGQSLVCYVVATPKQVPSTHELRDYLKTQLPSYMVPAALVFLSAVPTTPSGKVDHNALSALELQEPEDARDALPADYTATEQVLIGIWAEVLARKRVGSDDNFFELGGDSLLATRVISRIRGTFQVELYVRHFFEAPVLSALAKVIESSAGGRRLTMPTTPISPTKRDEPLALSFAQQRLWFIDQLTPGDSAYNIPGVLRLTGSVDVEVLKRCLGEVVRRHESLRTVFPIVEAGPLQEIRPPMLPHLPLVDLRELPVDARADEAHRLVRQEALRPFDLSEGPLFRTALIRLKEDEHLLSLNMHHIVSDGWSLRILLEELAILWGAFDNEEPSPLPELPVQYVDYALWQRRRLKGDVLEAQLSYWREQLGGSLSALQLPMDLARDSAPVRLTKRQSVHVTRELADSLSSLCRQEGITLFMLLLATFNLLLSRYSGQEDICVGCPIAGRNYVETERLIGFFVNTLVLRTDLSGEPSFIELVGRVREAALGAYTHQDVPFEKLVAELNPKRSMSGAPLFQVIFNFQEAPPSNLEFSGLQMNFSTVEGQTAKVDLKFDAIAAGGGLKCWLEYCVASFSEERMAIIARHLSHLLEQVSENPYKSISDYSLTM
jgi:amino acid adenylation domain-containing protein